jgi:uncharacterized protein YbjT (DUF2867 family)
MKNTILIAGSTGLVGSTFLDLIKEDQHYEKIIALTRKKILKLESCKKVRQQIINFDDLEHFNDLIKAKTLFCALGTTIKKAGSKENFRRVDFQYPVKIAEIALKNGAENIIIVSSTGADSKSRSFYLKTKGELEDAVSQMGFSGIHILRPSLLTGNRGEFRLMEEIVKLIVSSIQFILPHKYKPIHALTLSKKIRAISEYPEKGCYVYEGKKLISGIKD